MLDLRSVRIAVALADTGSATKAARALGMSQPGVSYHLKKLEESLAVSLFDRAPSGLVPTAEGELLVTRGRALLVDLEGLEHDIRFGDHGAAPVIRVSSACFTNYHWLPTVLQALRRTCGEIRIELDVDPSRRPFEALDRGALDVALTTLPPGSDRFTLHRLFDDEIVAVMHPEHTLAARSHLEPVDFADESLVMFDRTQSDLFNLCLRPAGVTPRHVTDMPVTEAILELVRAGTAISAMASWVARPDLDGGRLRAVRIGAEGLRRTWCAVTSARRNVPAHVEEFLNILVEASGPAAA